MLPSRTSGGVPQPPVQALRPGSSVGMSDRLKSGRSAVRSRPWPQTESSGFRGLHAIENDLGRPVPGRFGLSFGLSWSYRARVSTPYQDRLRRFGRRVRPASCGDVRSSTALSSARSTRPFWTEEAVGSNPATPTPVRQDVRCLNLFTNELRVLLARTKHRWAAPRGSANASAAQPTSHAADARTCRCAGRSGAGLADVRHRLVCVCESGRGWFISRQNGGAYWRAP